jgi:hypothetical protein
MENLFLVQTDGQRQPQTLDVLEIFTQSQEVQFKPLLAVPLFIPLLVQGLDIRLEVPFLAITAMTSLTWILYLKS